MKRPILCAFFAFASGIVAGFSLDLPIILAQGVFCALFLVCLILYRWRAKRGSWMGLASMCHFGILLCLGFIFCELSTYTRSKNHITQLDLSGDVEVVGEVKGDLFGEREWGYLLVRPLDVRTQGKRYLKPKGLIRLKVWGGGRDFYYGDKVKFTKALHFPSFPQKSDSFDYRGYLARQDIFLIGTISDLEIKMLEKGRGVFTYINRIRRWVRSQSTRLLPPPLDSLLLGIMWGERRALPEPLKEAFYRTGLGHILCVSGLHIGMLGFIFYFISRRVCLLPRRWASCLSILSILLYAVLVGCRPSVIRSTIMAISVLLGVFLLRKTDVYTNLALAGLIILLLEPRWLLNISFQFSFLAVFGIVSITPLLSTMWQKAIFLIKERRHVGLLQQGKVLRLVSRFTITPFFVSLSAWLALAPSVLYYFHRVSPLAVPLNIIVVPLVGIILTIGFIAFLISPISLSVAKGVSFLNVGLLSACAKIVEVSSCARFVALDVSCIPSLLVFMYYGVGVILVFYLRQRLIPHSEESPA